MKVSTPFAVAKRAYFECILYPRAFIAAAFLKFLGNPEIQDGEDRCCEVMENGSAIQMVKTLPVVVFSFKVIASTLPRGDQWW